MNAIPSLDARKIIAELQQSAPVKVVNIAHALGLKVYSQDNWDDDISGMIIRDKERGGKSEYAIYVNSKHAEVRQRFTIGY